MKKFLSAIMILALLAGAACAAGEEGRMSALITSVDGDQFTVKWANDREYTFTVSSDSDMSDITGGLAPGRTVFLSYTGQIDWDNQDASSVHVDYMSDGDMDEIDYISGLVEDAGMQTLTISWVNGHDYIFAVYSDADRCDFEIGDAVKVGYIGMIDWEQDDTSLTHVVSIEPGAADEVNQVEGTIYDASMNAIMIKTDDGDIYGFPNYGDADMSGLPDGPAIGERVIVSFVGTLEYIDYAHMISVTAA